MALIEVIGAIKSEPSVIKPEPPAIAEICYADVQSSDEEDNNQIEKKDIPESEVVVVEAEDGDRPIFNDFCATENLREDERLVLNFNKQVVPVTNEGKPKECDDREKVDWASLYKTHETTNCLEEEKKVKRVYGSSWHKPIQQEEYTYMSKTSLICNYCHREFNRQNGLARHIRVLHRESGVIHHCPYCPKQSRWSLKTHILTKHKNENEIKWFECHDCGKKCRLKTGLVSHIHEVHLGTKREKKESTCPICERVFNNKKLMQIHVTKEHERKYQCDKCSFTGQCAGSLKRHIEVRHTDPNELPIYQCSKCDFKTRYKHYYNAHCKRHEMTYFCDECVFMTSSSEKLNLHKNIHKDKLDDETLKYQCKKCDYKTYRHYSFQVHKLNHLKPEEINYFYCYHCNFKAKRKDNLKVHVTRHFKKEEVTLKCFICDFETKKRDTLMKHINGHQTPPQINEEEYYSFRLWKLNKEKKQEEGLGGLLVGVSVLPILSS